MFFKRKVEQRSYSLAEKEILSALGIDADGLSVDKAKEATFFTCLRILTDKVSSLPLKLYYESGKGKEKAVKHYLYKLLKLRPNKYMSSADFWRFIEFNRAYYGHSVVAINWLPSGRIGSLHPLETDKVTVYYDKSGLLGLDKSIWYVYRDGGKEYKFSSDDVLHFKGMSKDGILGMSVANNLNTNIENLQYGSDYVNKYFKGGLTAKGLLQVDTADMDMNAINRLKKRFESMSTGMNSVGKILTVPLGYSFKEINSTMADAQFVELNKLSIQQITAAFGIKMHQVNDLSGAKFNNVQSQNEEFYRDTLLPILTTYEQELTYKLLTEKEIEDGHYFEFNVDALLRTDLLTRYQAYGIGIDRGFLRPNEARKLENLPDAEGGDQLFVNGTYQPLEKVGMSYDNQPKGGENIDEEGN